VADRRRHVREASDGRLGYLHIPDMLGKGWAQFHRDLRTEMRSEGLVVDEYAGSDGDIIAVAIQELGLGPVVGTRTWGGVVGIDMPGHELVDGTTINVPRYAHWFEGRGWDVENHGVDPDVEVVPTPADWAAGADPQLDTAVRLALEALTARPAVTPPGPPSGTG
jgi:tricorn protease